MKKITNDGINVFMLDKLLKGKHDTWVCTIMLIKT